MEDTRRTYRGQDLACLVPTMDRPVRVRALLESLVVQTVPCGRIMIVDGGESIESLVAGFRDRLPVDYDRCTPPGQIRQRKLGLSMLDARTPLVGFMDDDLVLEPDAVEEMIACWNRVAPETAGIGFNIVSEPPRRGSLLAALFLMGSAAPGRVLYSGYNTRMHNIESDTRTQWLGGGYTVWRRDVLDRHPQDELRTRWAIGEDLRYSYPIGKERPLYVCASAKVHHMQEAERIAPPADHRRRGRKGAVSLFYFAAQHPELSRIACLWMLFGRCIGYCATGLVKFDAPVLHNGLGQLQALGICIGSFFGLADLRSVLED